MYIKLYNKNTIWFVSDTHFGHENSLKLFRQNEFDNVDKMDQHIIEQWNKVVGEQDIVIHLGDFAYRNVKPLESYVNQLNGNIYLLRGNHDNFQSGQVKHLFSVYDYLELDVKDEDTKYGWQKIVCMHYPILSYNGMYRESIHCYGHVHKTTPDNAPPKSVNCCVEMWGYTPVSYNTIKNTALKIGIEEKNS
jgi:calcineurin-like phosphoesterase family protein